MELSIYSIRQFRGHSGLSVTVNTTRQASGKTELDSLVNDLERFYKKYSNDLNINISKKPKTVDENSLLYAVLDPKSYIGSIKITPKGVSSKVDTRPDEDYPIADSSRYLETYFIYFFPKDKSLRRPLRDGFVKFVDSSGKKTKRN